MKWGCLHGRRICNSRNGRKTYILHGSAGVAYPVATAVVVPRIVRHYAVQALPEPPSVGATGGMATLMVGGNLCFSTSNMEEEVEDMGGRRKRERMS